MKKWTKEEKNILKERYSTIFAKDIAILLNRSLKSVQTQINQLNLNKIWTEKEIKTLKDFYPEEGVLVQERLPNRTKNAVTIKAVLLKIKNTNRKASQKKIIEDLGNNKILAECEKHGITIWYYYHNNKRSKCLRCHREYLKKYRKSTLGNYKSRIQSSLKSYTRGIAHFSKHLPYNAKELMDYLENIRKNQNNCCPTCKVSYNINPYDIDHIIPVSTGKTIEEIIKLYYLNNLTLLCYKCNRFIKRNKIGVNHVSCLC